MNIDTQSTFEARGYTWMRHTPGDPCPVPPDTLVHILMRCQEEGAQEAAKAKLYDWGIEDLQVEGQIIGWRYAETPQPSAPDTNE